MAAVLVHHMIKKAQSHTHQKWAVAVPHHGTEIKVIGDRLDPHLQFLAEATPTGCLELLLDTLKSVCFFSYASNWPFPYRKSLITTRSTNFLKGATCQSSVLCHSPGSSCGAAHPGDGLHKGLFGTEPEKNK